MCGDSTTLDDDVRVAHVLYRRYSHGVSVIL